MTTASILLAAGQGTRMHSTLPKVLHQIAGKPMIWHALKAVQGITDLPPVCVVGYGADAVKEAVQQSIGEAVAFATQEPQLGTGHAVAAAQTSLEGRADTILVTFADMPLLRKESLEILLGMHRRSESPVTMTSFIGDEAHGFGRVLRDAEGNITAIVEQAVATPDQLAIREYNVSAYCFDAEWLWDALVRIPVSNIGDISLTHVNR